ncbi:MAG: molecular chaperone TorD family protein, partial [Deltaproteobacteria bacterium]
HPYESVHRSKKRLFKQEPYDQVIQALRESGLGKREECKELEDHIALEFEYMEILCGDTMLALGENQKRKVHELLERQRLFLVRHLLRWVPGFCRKVCQEARSQFYQGIALITEAFISSERGRIDKLKRSLVYI